MLSNFLRKYQIGLVIFALAVLVRLLYLGLSLHAHGGDLDTTISGADCYYVISQNLLAGHGYSCDEAAPYSLNSIRPPVFPYFLAAGHVLGGTYWLPLLFQIALGSLVPLLGMSIARYLGARRKVAAVLGVLLAVEPNSILFSVIFYSETLFTVLFLSSVVCLFRYLRTQERYDLVLSAVLLGLATLTKPTGEYAALIFAAALVWNFWPRRKTQVVSIIIFAGIFILTLSPWLYRNYHAFGVVGVSPQLGEQLYAVLVPSVLSFERGTTFAQEFSAMLAQGGADPNQASIQNGSDYLHKAVPILLAHPYGLLVVSANTALNFYIHDGMIEVLKHVEVRATNRLGKPALFLLLSDPLALARYIGSVLFTPLILILVGRLLWVGITLCAVLGAVRYLRREAQKLYATICITLVLYFMLTTLVIGLAITARYRLPVNALILAFALYEVVSVVALARALGVRKVWRELV